MRAACCQCLCALERRYCGLLCAQIGACAHQLRAESTHAAAGACFLLFVDLSHSLSFLLFAHTAYAELLAMLLDDAVLLAQQSQSATATTHRVQPTTMPTIDRSTAAMIVVTSTSTSALSTLATPVTLTQSWSAPAFHVPPQMTSSSPSSSTRPQFASSLVCVGVHDVGAPPSLIALRVALAPLVDVVPFLAQVIGAIVL